MAGPSDDEADRVADRGSATRRGRPRGDARHGNHGPCTEHGRPEARQCPPDDVRDDRYDHDDVYGDDRYDDDVYGDDRHAEDRHGDDRYDHDDAYGEDRHGDDVYGDDRHGEDRHGDDRHGEDRHGEDRHGEDRPAQAEPYDHRDDLGEPDLTRRRFRAGRGGYDPEAAALAARARYAFRQRMVVALVLLAIASGLVAWGLGLPAEWWVHGGVDLCLVGYLVYLRRQVRLEQAIRSRRAARHAGHGAGNGGEQWDPAGDRYVDLDDAVAEHPQRVIRRRRHDGPKPAGGDTGPATALRNPGPARLSVGPARGAVESADEPPALPRLRPSSPPVQPRGTVLLELDAEDPELHKLEARPVAPYRPAGRRQ
jgi:hypothetical protein